MGGKNQFYLDWISVSWREFYFEGRRRTFLAMSIERGAAVKDLSFFQCLTMTSLFLMGNTPTFPVSCAEKRSIVSCDGKNTSQQQGIRLLREIEKKISSRFKKFWYPVCHDTLILFNFYISTWELGLTRFFWLSQICILFRKQKLSIWAAHWIYPD